MKRKILVISLLIFALPLLAGCKISFGGGSTKTDENNIGGIFKSTDYAETWANKVAVPTITGTPASIGAININKIIFDPQDHLTVYLASKGNGLIFSYNAGEAWQVPRTQPDKMKNIEDIAVDPQNSCTIYAAAGNRIFKSVNCARSWEEIYYGTRESDIVLNLAVDWYSPAVVYAGTSEGNTLQSTDYGRTWTAVERPGNKIRKIMIDPYDSRIVYVVTDKNGIIKTVNKGGTWEDIRDQFKEYKGSNEYRDITFSLSEPNTLYFASKYGILKTTNGGIDWTPIELITKDGGANIMALAVDPKNGKNLYYATQNTFYKSTNGGSDWLAKQLPTSRAATALGIDFEQPAVVYMGVSQLSK